jgi:endo-1,4-beta-xylanase
MKLNTLYRSLAALCLATALPAQVTLRQASAERALLIGAAANADEYGIPNRLNEAAYAATLSGQFSMLEAENAMKWNPIHPSETTFNFSPGDKLVAFAQSQDMRVRGHTLVWHGNNPAWLTARAQSATPAAMAAVLRDHIMNVAGHYQGKIFAWDVVNEAIADNGTLRSSIWYDQPGIGLTGTGYVEQAFRWAREAAPDALLFYNDYNVEGPGTKFNALYNMVKDFVERGIPIDGVGLQMHLTTGGYPDSAGLSQNIQRLTALGLQVHITEMDVRLKVDSSGAASASDLQIQAQIYGKILTVCLQNPGCTAIQTWGFTDKYSWIPGSFPGFGAALPFDAAFQSKPAVQAMIDAMRSVPPTLKASNIVNSASFKEGAVAPGELITLFGANYGPSRLVFAQPDRSNVYPSALAGVQVFFDGIPAPLIYAQAGQVSVVVPYQVAGKQQTTVQYQFGGVASNTVALTVAASAPGIFSANSSGSGSGAILNQDNSVNTDTNPERSGNIMQIFATGGGTVAGGAANGALAPGVSTQTLPVSVTIGGLEAPVAYAGSAPGLLNGLLQVNIVVPAGLNPGPQDVIVKVGGVPSQPGIIVSVRQ